MPREIEFVYVAIALWVFKADKSLSNVHWKWHSPDNGHTVGLTEHASHA